MVAYHYRIFLMDVLTNDPGFLHSSPASFDLLIEIFFYNTPGLVTSSFDYSHNLVFSILLSECPYRDRVYSFQNVPFKFI